MKKLKSFYKWGFILLLPIAILLANIASSAPEFIEEYYSTGLYHLIGQCLSNISGILPISMAEFLIIFLIVFIIYRLIKTIIILIGSKRRNKGYILLNYIRKMFIFISVGYFVFICIWGLNYHRLPFSEIAGLDTHEGTVDELTELCESLIIHANELRNNVNEDANGVMYILGGHVDVFSRANEGYKIAANIYSELGGKYGRPKGVVFSEAMSYSGITGMYFPFTAEANVNKDRPDVLLPATTCHEMAHQRGFAREDEANYIAYLTCKMHPDVDFQYSGTLLAIIHSMNKLHDYDLKAYKQLKGMYSAGVLRDLTNNNKFWQRYSGPIDEASTKINNAYLKSNMQKDGVHSYGRMVDLLIAEHRLVNSQK